MFSQFAERPTPNVLLRSDEVVVLKVREFRENIHQTASVDVVSCGKIVGTTKWHPACANSSHPSVRRQTNQVFENSDPPTSPDYKRSGDAFIETQSVEDFSENVCPIWFSVDGRSGLWVFLLNSFTEELRNISYFVFIEESLCFFQVVWMIRTLR